MIQAIVYHKTTEGVQSICNSQVLKDLEVQFANIIIFTNPPCIDSCWPDSKDRLVREQLELLGCDKIFVRPPRNPAKEHTITTKKTGVFMLDDIDRDEAECGIVVISMKFSRGIWSASMPRELHMLKGIIVHGQDITAVYIAANALQWRRETAPSQEIRVMRPGNICWPAFYMCWDSGLKITVDAPANQPPQLQLVWFTLNDHNKRQLWHSDCMYALEFDGGDTYQRIGKFMAGLAGSRYQGSKEYGAVEEDIISKAQEQIMQDASDANQNIEDRREETFTICELS